MFDSLRTALTTAWMRLVHPRPPLLAAPTEAQLERQDWASKACGPCAATTVLRLLGGRADRADSERVLLGTFENGQTSVDALAEYLEHRGVRSAIVPVLPGHVVAVMTDALRGGAYCIPLVRTPVQQPSTLAHFTLVYGVQAGLVLSADSLRGRLAIPTTTFGPAWAVPVSGRAGMVPIIVVRRA